MTNDEVKGLLLYGSKLWPHTFTLPESQDEMDMTQLAWYRQFRDMGIDLVMAAMDNWTDHYPPTPRELRDAAARLLMLAQGQRVPDSDEAWQEFRLDYRADYDGQHQWSHPCIADAARALGCRAYGQSLTEDVATWRAQFRGYYEVAVKRFMHEGVALPPSVAAYISEQTAISDTVPPELGA